MLYYFTLHHLLAVVGVVKYLQLLDISAEENGRGLMATLYKHRKVSRVFREVNCLKRSQLLQLLFK
jgi:hypothetical protein